MKYTQLFSLILFFAALTGCSSDGEKRHEYLDAYTVEALEVPPKLTVPDTKSALRLPEPALKDKKTNCQ